MLLPILTMPDPRLRRIAQPIDSVTPELVELGHDMLETMYDAPGIGLAATQVGRLERFFVFDVSEERDAPHIIFNPEIIARDGSHICEEGCLSVPGIFAEVERADKITLRFLDNEGKSQKADFDGLAAVCIQHEIDHLDGKLFVDYLSPLKRRRVEKKLEKLKRQEAA